MRSLHHPFELKGLGQAPFHCVEVREAETVAPSGKIRPGPSGRCAYCGKRIRYEFWVVSADGKRFSVGRDCIARLDFKLSRSADEARRHFKSRTAAELRTRIRDMLNSNPKLWTDEPHPHYIFGKTRRDYIEFVLAHAGDAKVVKVCAPVARRK